MKVIGLTGGLSSAEFIVTMSRAEMARVVGENYLPDEKLPKVGCEVKLVKAWEIVTYMRDRPGKLDSLLEAVKAIEKSVAIAIDDISTPLIIET